MRDVIIITGGTSGLGLELVKQSIERGYLVCNIGRNTEKMEVLNRQFGDNHKGFIGDISDEEFVNNTIDNFIMFEKIFYLIDSNMFSMFFNFYLNFPK